MRQKRYITTDLSLRMENKTLQDFDDSYYKRRESYFHYNLYEDYDKSNKAQFEYYITLDIFTFCYEDLIIMLLEASKEGFIISIPDEEGTPFDLLLFENSILFKVVEQLDDDCECLELDLNTLQKMSFLSIFPMKMKHLMRIYYWEMVHFLKF